MIDAPAPPTLYPKQREAIEDPARVVIIDASTKSGKTAGCLVWSYKHRINKPNSKGLWIEPTYAMAHDIGYARLVGMMTRSDPAKRIWNCSESRMEVTFANGAIQRFKGGDKPDGIYGEDYDDAVIDEGSRCKEAVWAAVRSTLSHTRGPVRIIGNVKGRKNWAYRLGQKARGGERDMAYHKLTALDAVAGGVMHQDEIDDAKRDLPEAVFRELYMAEPTEDGANPFDMRAIAACVRPLTTGEPVGYGVDLAKSQDWTVVMGLDADGMICSYDRWQGDWRRTKRRLVEILGNTFAIVDSTGVGDPIVEDLQASGCNVEGFKFSMPSKQQIITGLCASLQRGETSVLDNEHRSELESFEYVYTSSGVKYSAPDGMHDDTVYAHALAIKACGERSRNEFACRMIEL